MEKTCPHVGKEHPMNFQCMSCEDTADECNCNHAPMVFCDLCQKPVMISTEDVVEAWYETHPDLDLRLEKLKIQGVIAGYKSSIVNQEKR